MNRLDNLRPFNTMTPEERRAIAVKAGIASGAARRAKRERINQAKIELIAASELSKAMTGILIRGLPRMKSGIGERL